MIRGSFYLSSLGFVALSGLEAAQENFGNAAASLAMAFVYDRISRIIRDASFQLLIRNSPIDKSKLIKDLNKLL